MRFYINKREGSVTLQGALSDKDAGKLESTLMIPLMMRDSLKLNIDNVTSISYSCVNIITRAIQMARKNRKQLLLDTRYRREAMVEWIQYVYSRPEKERAQTYNTTTH